MGGVLDAGRQVIETLGVDEGEAGSHPSDMIGLCGAISVGLPLGETIVLVLN